MEIIFPITVFLGTIIVFLGTITVFPIFPLGAALFGPYLDPIAAEVAVAIAVPVAAAVTQRELAVRISA